MGNSHHQRALPKGHAAVSAAVLGIAGTAASQVISSQPAAALSPASFRASARMQAGLLRRGSYQGAVVGGSRITSPLNAAITAAGGAFSSTNNSPWSANRGNDFSLAYNAATQSLTLTVFKTNGNVDFAISDTANLATARAVNLSFAQLNASSFGSIALSTAAGTVSLGPASPTAWSSTVLAQSTLSGWNLAANWTITGNLVIRKPEQDWQPGLGIDIVNQPLGYQLSAHAGVPGTPTVLNYGVTGAMSVTTADFRQAQWGGIDGVIAADIQSRGAVTFDVTGTQRFEGALLDLGDPLVQPSYWGTASLVKAGTGTLLLSGSNAYGGDTVIVDGALGISAAGRLGAGSIVFGDGTGAGSPVLRYGGAAGVLSNGVGLQGSDATLDVLYGTLALTGQVSDSGSHRLVKQGAGTLILATSGSYGGTLDVNSGVVAIASDEAIGAAGVRLGDATLRFDIDFTGLATQELRILGTDSAISDDPGERVTWAGALTGAVGTGLTVRGVDLAVTGDATGFLGTLSAESAARIQVSGDFGGRMVLADAFLRAAGANPRRAAELRIAGSLELGARSTLGANLFLSEHAPDQRDSDTVAVAGSATMAGALRAVWDSRLAPGSFVPLPRETKTWRLLTTPSGSGAFGSGLLEVVDARGGGSYTLPLVINGTVERGAVEFTTVVDGSGASLTVHGVGVDPSKTYQTDCGPMPGTELNDIIADLHTIETQGTDDARLVAALILLQPAADIPGYVVATRARNPYATPSVVMDSTAMAGQTAMLRLMQLHDGDLGRMASRASGASRPDGGAAGLGEDLGAALNGPLPDEGGRLWARGFGFTEDVDGQDCEACGYQGSAGGMMVGGDAAVDGGGILGLFAGLGPGEVSIDAPHGTESDSVETAMFGAYGSIVGEGGGWWADGFALGAYSGVRRVRTASIQSLRRTMQSNTSNWSVTAGGQAGISLRVAEGTTLQPYVGAVASRWWGASYDEYGDSSLNLSVQAQDACEIQPSAGARLMHSTPSAAGILTPYAGAAFVAELPVGTWAPTYTSDFNLGRPIQLQTEPPDRYGVEFQAGLELAAPNGMTAFVAFEGSVLTGKQRYGGQVGLLFRF